VEIVQRRGVYGKGAGGRGHGAVSGGLHAGGQSVGAGEPDGLHHVGGRTGLDDGGGPHRDGEVPRRDERRVLVVGRLVHASAEADAELVQRGALGGQDEGVVREGGRDGGH